MSQKSSFFNSVNGDRKYNAETFASYFKSFIGNGVYPNPSSNLIVSAAAGMNITIAAGKGFINGYFYENTTPLNKAIDVSDGVLKRIDRVVLRLDHVGRQITIEVKKGTPASTPTAPALTRNADIHELALADVRINNGDTNVLQANITDQRLNTSLCGIVHGVVEQVDTAAIFTQYQAALNDFETIQQAEFENWVNGLKQVLDENTAGNLLNLINDHKGDSNAHFTQGEKSELQAKFNAEGKALKAVSADYATNADFVAKNFTVNVGLDWGTAAPYSQNITASGVLETDNPIVDIILSSDTEAAINQEKEYGKVSKIITSNGSITVVCLKDKPELAFTIQLKVVR